MKFDTIETVTRDICEFRGDPDGKTFLKVSKAVRRVLDDLQLYMVQNIKSEILTIQDNLTIDYPSEAYFITKVGIPVTGQGLRIMGRRKAYSETLIRGEAICTCGNTCEDETTSETITDQNTTGAACSACTFHNVCWQGEVGEFYGYRPDVWGNGTFDDDEANRRIIFNSGYDIKVGGEVVVEYKSSGTLEEKYYMVPHEFFPVIMERVNQWLSPTRDKAYHFDQFRRNYRQLKRRYDKLTVQDWINAFRGGYMSAPKR